MIYPITPMPAPRLSHQGRFTDRAKRYYAWCDEVRVLGVKVPDHGARITFHIPMPKSWSKKKRMENNKTPHQQTPDLDNLLKALLDAIKKGEGDHAVWQFTAAKLWSLEGAIEIETH